VLGACCASRSWCIHFREWRYDTPNAPPLACRESRERTFVEPRASMGEKLSKKQQRNQVAAKRLDEQRAATAEGFKGADPAGGTHNPGQCTFTFRALQRRLSGLIVVPLPAAPRAPAALSAASGQSPRTLGGIFGSDPGIKWCAQCDVSHWGDTPEGGKATRANGCAHTTPPAPLPARNQADIFSVCFQQEPHVNKVLLLFVAHA
jgi:hypothetical protein